MKIKKFNELNEGKNNTSLEELYHIYEIEGHGYAVEDYSNNVSCDDDPEVAILWNNAAESLKKLTNYFNEKVEDGTLEYFEY
jgi:hypothetical protein